MNDLLFYALILALVYYLLIHQQKPLNNTTKPFTQTTSTQTESLSNPDEQELANTINTLITNIQQLNKQLK